MPKVVEVCVGGKSVSDCGPLGNATWSQSLCYHVAKAVGTPSSLAQTLDCHVVSVM